MRLSTTQAPLAPIVLTALTLLGACGAGTLQPSLAADAGSATDATSTSPANGDAGATNTNDGNTVAANGAAGDSNSTATPTASNNQTTPNGTSVMPSFFFGVLPDYDNAATQGLSGWINRTGVVPTATSAYVQVKADGTLETSYGVSDVDEAKKLGAKIISLSLTARYLAPQLTDTQMQGLQTIIDEAQKQNIELHLRYGYEMNFGGGDDQFKNINNNNDPNYFLSQWTQVAALANPYRNKLPAVKMFWSPNIQSGGTLPYKSWFPSDPNTIDVVGVDWYHSMGDTMTTDSIVSSVADVYALASAHNLPFTLGETGLKDVSSSYSAEAQEKANWLAALSNPAVRQKMPLFRGFYWFDYIKGGTWFTISQDSLAVPLFKTWYASTFGS